MPIAENARISLISGESRESPPPPSKVVASHASPCSPCSSTDLRGCERAAWLARILLVPTATVRCSAGRGRALCQRHRRRARAARRSLLHMTRCRPLSQSKGARAPSDPCVALARARLYHAFRRRTCAHAHVSASPACAGIFCLLRASHLSLLGDWAGQARDHVLLANGATLPGLHDRARQTGRRRSRGTTRAARACSTRRWCWR